MKLLKEIGNFFFAMIVTLLLLSLLAGAAYYEFKKLKFFLTLP